MDTNLRKLILFDWDNTIVNGTYQIIDSRFKATIREKISDGWWIGLNSDTPLRRLQVWWKSLGMNGPIVAEKGAVIWWPTTKEVIVSQTSDIFSAFRREVILSLTQMLEIGLFVGDSMEFIRSVQRIEGGNSVFVALDAYRMCSLGIFVRRIEKGWLSNDYEAAERIRDQITPFVPFHPLVSAIDFNPEYGFMSVNSLDADKTIGVKALLEKWGATSKLIMVGDSIADYIELPGVLHFAVGNARPEYKEKAHRIATRNYTEGCVELLSTI
jgi:hydroxymethylpyrimidine pyrophosphatase-like HAD family hydrolase